MKMEFELTEAQYEALMTEAKNEVREELTDEAIHEYLKKQDSVDISEVLDDLDLYSKIQAIREKKVKDLSINQMRLICMYALLHGGNI